MDRGARKLSAARRYACTRCDKKDLTREEVVPPVGYSGPREPWRCLDCHGARVRAGFLESMRLRDAQRKSRLT